MNKSGWKTTEFWVVVVAAVVSVAVAGGYISANEAEQIKSSVAEVIDAVTKLVTALTPVVSVVMYVWSRTKVKVS